jgi:TonB family protein
MDLEGLESYDLVHVIDELEDDRARALLREKIWIALILHMVFFALLALAPRYFPVVRVRESSDLKDKNKQMTFLDLPPDALKQLKPKNPAHLSDQDRVQQTPKPQPQRQDLDQMRRAGPPAPQPAPQQQTRTTPPPAQQAPAPPQQAQQAPAPPQQAQQPPVQRPPQPLPHDQNQSAQVEAPAPRPTTPSFKTGAGTPGEAVQQAARQAENGGYPAGGDMGANAPSAHGGMNGAVDVLSDTLGVDFGPYIQRVIYDTKRAWYPIIPPSAQPPLSKQGRVLIRFKILPDGSVKEMKLEGPSGDVSLDRAAWGGITGGSPFPPLPKNFKGPFLELRFYFLYNERPGVQ